MAKRTAVRRGRKNPNAGISRATEHQSVQPDFEMPKSTTTDADSQSSAAVLSEDGSKTKRTIKGRGKRFAGSEGELRIFPMSGAVDRTAEFETRRALDKKLDAILGKSNEEDTIVDEVPKRQVTKEGRPAETSALTEQSHRNDEFVRAENTQITNNEENSETDYEEAHAYREPEVTDTGSVLFDAVLPKGHGIGQIGRKIAGKNFGKAPEIKARHHADDSAERNADSISDEHASVDDEAEDKLLPTIGQATVNHGSDTNHKNSTKHKTEKKHDSKQTAHREAKSVSDDTDTADDCAVPVPVAAPVPASLSGGKAAVSVYDLKKDREAVEKRIQAEVERRVSKAETELEPQVIISPKAVKRSRMTMMFVALGLVALALISIILGINYDRMNRTLTQANQELDFYKGLMNGENVQAAEPTEAAGSSGQAGVQVRKEDETRRVYLTFDDGPSEVTVETLDILATYGVKATFFVNGKDDDRSSYIYNRIVDEGHTLAMHGNTHDFDTIYASLGNFSEDLHTLRNLLYDKTGGRVWCKYYRFPGGSSTTTAKTDMKELIAYLDREGIIYYDWNVYGGDDIDAATIISNIKASTPKYKNVIILLHDAADKKATVEALPGIIEYLQGLDDTVLLPITDDTVPIQHGVQ